MWLPRLFGLHVILVLAILQQTYCLASPPHLAPIRKRAPSNSPGSTIDANGLQRRVTDVHSVRVVQYLREIINIAPAGDGPANNDDIWRICLEHVSNVVSINSGVNVQTISDVATKLMRLYELAMTTLWEIIETHEHPSDDTDDTFSLSLGQVAIEWVCRQGPLCWHLLHDFCIVMKEKARQGWTGMYSGELVNVGTGVVTWVRLTIKRGRGE